MQVNANIDEADVGRMRPGQVVTFRVDAFPNDTFTGSVEQVRLQPTTVQNVVTYQTVIEVPNPAVEAEAGHDGQRQHRDRAQDQCAAHSRCSNALPSDRGYVCGAQPGDAARGAAAGSVVAANAGGRGGGGRGGNGVGQPGGANPGGATAGGAPAATRRQAAPATQPRDGVRARPRARSVATHAIAERDAAALRRQRAGGGGADRGGQGGPGGTGRLRRRTRRFDPNMTPEERRKRMEERMAAMTPEERAAFQERMAPRQNGQGGGGRRRVRRRAANGAPGAAQWQCREQRRTRTGRRHAQPRAARQLPRAARPGTRRQCAVDQLGRNDDRFAVRRAPDGRNARPRVALHQQAAEAGRPAPRHLATARTPRSSTRTELQQGTEVVTNVSPPTSGNDTAPAPTSAGSNPLMGPQRGRRPRAAGPAVAADAAARLAASVTMKPWLSLSIRDLSRPTTSATSRSARCAAPYLDVERGRVRRRHRPVGIRQVDAHAHPRLPRSPDERARTSSTARTCRGCRRTNSRSSATARSASCSRDSTCCRGRRRSTTSSCRCSTTAATR